MENPSPRDAVEPHGPWEQAALLSFRFFFLAICVAAIGWSLSNFREVPPDSRAVVFRFGNIARQQDAGLLMAWPAPIERVVLVPSSDRQMEFRIPQFEPSPPGQDYIINPDPRRSAAFLLTGDASVVHLEGTLLYQIVDPLAYVLSADHVGPALERLFVASAVSVCAQRDLDTILVARPELDVASNAAARAGREQLRADLMNAINRRLEELAGQGAGLGVMVSRVDLAAAIPYGAKSAFDYVLIVSQQAEADIAQARTGATVVALQANQERDRLLADSAAKAEERITEAKARTATISALRRGAPGLSGEMLVNRIYYDRVGPLLARAARVDTIDKEGGMNLMLPGPVPQ
jgi:regulator of protease activity HflC (stomatin/prohibitin superfamily)